AAWTMDTAITANITIVAQWTKNGDPAKEYWTVTIDLDNGETPTTKKVEKGQKLTGITEPTKEGYTFAGWKVNGSAWTMDEAITADITIVAQWTLEAEKFTVSFDSKGGSAVAALNDVVDGSKIVAPKEPTRSGYRFAGWYQDEDYTDAWDFDVDTVTASMTLYANWEPLSLYQALVDKGGVVINDDFNSYTAVDTLPDFSGTWGTKGLYQYLNPKSGNNSKADNYVAFDGDTAHLVDKGADGTQMMIDFGDALNNGVIEGAFDLTLTTTANGWTFLQIYGTDAEKTNAEVFGFRAARQTGASSKDPIYINYRLDGGTVEEPADALEAVVNKPFHIYFLLDIENDQFTVQISNDSGATCVILDQEACGITELMGIKLVSGDGNQATMKIDNLVIRQDQIETSEYILKMQDKLQAEVDKLDLDTNYTQNKQLVLDALEIGQNAIGEQTDNAGVQQAYNDALATIKAIPNDTKQLIVDAQNTAIEELVLYHEANSDVHTFDATQAAYDEALEAGKALIRATVSDTEIDAALIEAKALLDAVETDAEYLVNYKEEKSTALEEAFDENNYTYDDNITLFETAMADGLNAIEEATTPALVDAALADAISAIEAIETNALVLSRYKNTYKTQLGAYEQDQIDQLEADGMTEEVELIAQAKATGAENIDNATIVSKVEEAYAAAIEAVDDIITLATADIEDIKQQAKDDLDAYIGTNNVDEIIDNIILSVNDYLTTQDEHYKEDYPLLEKDIFNDMDVTTVLTDLVNAAKDLIDAETVSKNIIGPNGIVNQYKQLVKEAVETAMLEIAKEALIADFETYALAKKDSIEHIVTQTNIEELITTTNEDMADEEKVYDLTSLMSYIMNSYASVDAMEENLKNGDSYRMTVTFANTTIAPQTNIIYEEYATQPANPTSANASFVGWYADEDLTEPFDFENTPIYNNTTVYAKWYDATFTTSTTSIVYDYTSSAFTALPTTDDKGYLEYHWNGESFTAGKGITTSNESKDTRYLKVTLTTTAVIKVTMSNTTKNVRNLFINTDPQGKPSTVPTTYGAIEVGKEAKSVVLTSNTLDAGVYYINWNAKSLVFEKIEILVEESSATIYTGISGTLNKTEYSEGLDEKVDITGLSLTVLDGEAINLTNDMITSGKITVEFTEGTQAEFDHKIVKNYKFKLHYGNYTVSEEFEIIVESSE
ncbi:MAG: InlB B-repeat-containing protein, partial [Anaeroplasmataceae bacterium]|nr:InlB B-repeat-containing protein [Anaeroplasmataceae bacterium]